MLKSLKDRSEAKEAENIIGEEGTQRSPIADNAGKNQNPSSDSLKRIGSTETLLKSVVGDDNVDTPRRKVDVHVEETRHEKINECDEDLGVSSTASRRRTRSSDVALEKKKFALGLGGDFGESMEPSKAVDLELMERKAKERKSSRKGKGKKKRASDIVDHVKTGAKLKPIGFPSLIYSLLITQHPTVLKKEDGLVEDAKSLTISDKLIKGKHVIDVEFNALDQSEPVPELETAGILHHE
ncbi:hypothetical protein LIER_28132 [Lithospermum erythrorhizon]|uniref:Uncharacterized protein n=1 Tax=Lithospermum erythrorhizon TaxID=34254 RepID=A0AAV3RKK3_LITER